MLGPLAVAGDDGVEIRVTAPKERTLLAVLALRAGGVVPLAELKAALWGEREPRSASKTLQGYVASLRRQLPAGAVESRGGSYRLRVDSGDVDALKFEHLVADGAHALGLGDAAEAAAVLGEAMMLWRGEPLADLADQPEGGREAARLRELRFGCEELLAETRLALGEHATLVGDLEAAVAAEPLREKRWSQLMLALYRCGRQADALRAYQRLRAELREQLGIEPSADVRSLEEAILLQKPQLDWVAPPRASRLGAPGDDHEAGWREDVLDSPPPRRHRLSSKASTFVGRRDEVPGNLPLQLSSFVGREKELSRVAQALEVSRLVTLTGVGGVGKTRLALQTAAEVLPRFPDGAWLCELDAIRDPELVAQTVAGVFKVTARPGATWLESLVGVFAGSDRAADIGQLRASAAGGRRLGAGGTGGRSRGPGAGHQPRGAERGRRAADSGPVPGVARGRSRPGGRRVRVRAVVRRAGPTGQGRLRN